MSGPIVEDNDDTVTDQYNSFCNFTIGGVGVENLIKLNSGNKYNQLSAFTYDTLHDEICPVIKNKPASLEDDMLNNDDLINLLKGSGIPVKKNDLYGLLFKDFKNIFLRDVFTNGTDNNLAVIPSFNSMFFDQAGHSHDANLKYLKQNVAGLTVLQNVDGLINIGGYCNLFPSSTNLNDITKYTHFDFTAVFNCDLLMFYTIMGQLGFYNYIKSNYIESNGTNALSANIIKIWENFVAPAEPSVLPAAEPSVLPAAAPSVLPAAAAAPLPLSYPVFLNFYKEYIKNVDIQGKKMFIDGISLVCLNFIWQRLINYCNFAMTNDQYINHNTRQILCEKVLKFGTTTSNALRNIYFETIQIIEPISATIGSREINKNSIGAFMCNYFRKNSINILMTTLKTLNVICLQLPKVHLILHHNKHYVYYLGKVLKN